MYSDGNPDEVYGATSLSAIVDDEDASLQVCNFSKKAVKIQKGKILGKASNPDTWFDERTDWTEEEYSEAERRAEAIKSMMEGLKSRRDVDEDFPEGKAAEGVPKTAETPPDDVKTSDLLKALDFSKDLTAEERTAIEEVVLKNSKAFGLDGRLGTHESKVDVPLKPDSKPVSLPPFPVSLASRKVM
ncbi:hypothetical protein SISNIDRAFT_420831, partial [Sistotremastrum niveocremeum HHB9708]